MLDRVSRLQQGEKVGRHTWNPRGDHVTRTAARLLKVMWRTGHRLGEAVRTSNEVTYFVRSDLV